MPDKVIHAAVGALRLRTRPPSSRSGERPTGRRREARRGVGRSSRHTGAGRREFAARSGPTITLVDGWVIPVKVGAFQRPAAVTDLDDVAIAQIVAWSPH